MASMSPMAAASAHPGIRTAVVVTGRQAPEKGDEEPLRALHTAGVRLVGPELAAWEPRRCEGAPGAAQRTGDGEHLTARPAGVPAHLSRARVRAAGPTRRGGYGMRGGRDEYELPGVTQPHHGE